MPPGSASESCLPVGSVPGTCPRLSSCTTTTQQERRKGEVHPGDVVRPSRHGESEKDCVLASQLGEEEAAPGRGALERCHHPVKKGLDHSAAEMSPRCAEAVVEVVVSGAL